MNKVGYIEVSMNGFGFIKDCFTGKQYFVHRSEFYSKTNTPNQLLGSNVLGQYVTFSEGIDGKTNRVVAKTVKVHNPENTTTFKYLPEPNFYNIDKDSKSKGTLNASKLISKKENLDLLKINEDYVQEISLENNYLFGDIIRFNQKDGIGFLKDEEGKNRKFYLSNVSNNIVLKNGDRVMFLPKDKENSYFAKDIIIQESKDLDRRKIDLYRSTRRWKLQAKMEDMSKMFYEIEEYSQIKNGEKCFIIGRKGSGKSAISEYITSQIRYNHFFEELRLGNFSFSEVVNIVNENDDEVNNDYFYVLVWKYIILGTVLRLMSKNKNIDSKITEILSNVFPENPWESKSFAKILRQWKFKELTLKIENYIDIKAERSDENQTFSLIEKISYFQHLIKEFIDSDSNYYVIFDEVQDDLYDNELRIESVKKLRALLRAIGEIKIEFRKNCSNILPLIFLRDDTFEMIDYNDKDKWRDFTITLNWTEVKIKKMLAHRISKTINSNEILNFDNAWKFYFPTKYAKTVYGNKEIFSLISNHTYLRPRDFVDFFITCCNRAINNDIDDLQKVYFSALKELSKSIRESIESELSGLLINIKEIMNLFSQQRLKAFSFKSFEKEYDEIFYENDKVYDARKAIEILFEYSVIGNVPYYNQEIFKYYNSKTVVNYNEPFIIHKSLFNSLNLF